MLRLIYMSKASKERIKLTSNAKAENLIHAQLRLAPMSIKCPGTKSIPVAYAINCGNLILVCSDSTWNV